MNRNFLIIAIGRVLQIGISLFSSRISTTLLDSSELGLVYLINAIVAFFCLFFLNPVDRFILRKLNQWDQERALLNNLLVYAIFLFGICLISTGVVWIIDHVFHFKGFVSLPLFIATIALSIYFSEWNTTLTWILNMLNHRMSATLFVIFTQALGLAVAVFLLHFWDISGIYWLLGTIISQCFISILIFIYLYRLIKQPIHLFKRLKKVKRSGLKDILVFTVPLSVATLFMWIQNQSYRLVIEQQLGLDFLGFLGVGLGLAMSISLAFESVIQQYYYPIFYKGINQANSEGKKEVISNMISLTIPFYLSLCIFVSCFSEFIITVLVNSKFYGAFSYLTFGIWVEFCRMATSIISNIAHSEMRTKQLILPYVFGGLVTIIGVYVASTLISYTFWIPIALVIGGATTLLAMVIQMRKLIHFRLNANRLFTCLLFSIPFGLRIFFIDFATKFIPSLLILGSFGIYFIISQYFLLKKHLIIDNHQL